MDEILQAVLKYLGELKPAQGLAAFVGALATGIATGAVRGWLEARKTNRMLKREGDAVDEQQRGPKDPGPQTDTALERYYRDRAIEAERRCVELAEALRAEEIANAALRRESSECERSNASLGSEVVAKTYELDRKEGMLRAVVARNEELWAAIASGRHDQIEFDPNVDSPAAARTLPPPRMPGSRPALHAVVIDVRDDEDGEKTPRPPGLHYVRPKGPGEKP